MEHNKYIMLKRLLHGVCQIYTLRIHVATNAIRFSYQKIAKSKKKRSWFSFLKKKIVFANENT